MALHGAPPLFEQSRPLVSLAMGEGPVRIPDAAALFRGRFEKLGSDLVVTGPDGKAFHLAEYFAAESPPALTSPEGAMLSADDVRALAGLQPHGVLGLQLAQAAAPGGVAPIGRVETLTGEASVTRGGAEVALAIGDGIFKGDVVSTKGNGKLGLKFADGTIFSMSAGARMVMNDLVYDPARADNTFSASVIEGTFVFLTGQVARTGTMRVQTPVATMGIRGTTPVISIDSVTGAVKFNILPDPDGRVGRFELISRLTGEVLGAVSNVEAGFSLASASSAPTEVRADLSVMTTLASDIGQLHARAQVSPDVSSSTVNPTSPNSGQTPGTGDKPPGSSGSTQPFTPPVVAPLRVVGSEASSPAPPAQTAQTESELSPVIVITTVDTLPPLTEAEQGQQGGSGPQNAAPTINPGPLDIRYVVVHGPSVIAPQLTLEDDGDIITGAQVSIDRNREQGDSLIVEPTAEISADSSDGVLILTGIASLEAYQDLLRTVSFATSSESRATRTLSVQRRRWKRRHRRQFRLQRHGRGFHRRR